MKLKKYRKLHKLTPAQFGKLFKKPVSAQTVRNWESGLCFPSRNIHELTKITGSDVTANDFINIKGK